MIKNKKNGKSSLLHLGPIKGQTAAIITRAPASLAGKKVHLRRNRSTELNELGTRSATDLFALGGSQPAENRRTGRIKAAKR